jgi:hypothetical protein
LKVLTATLLALFAATAVAADPGAAAPDKPANEEKVISLPKVEVTASKIREIDLALKRLDKQIAREAKRLEKTQADEVLNSEKASRAAALFGGKSAAQRASVTAVRLQSLEKERGLLESLKVPQPEKERKLVEKEIEAQRAYRRELDHILR